ncbi:cytochrome P450 2J5-like isoform X2 [Eublepharis macularius]|uniref:Cytochrome P450 2J5-like isoform X2 n=1 Tax=Eublepharis macularius TaxID=481883 RepID=A0AA97JJH0_EUBMA|nr:cytochrome P450 2J5-like isoform X2 [Eublepharis macularius]
MPWIWAILIAVLVCLLIVRFLIQLWSQRNYPPGPLRLPLIGGMWRVLPNFSEDILIKLAKQYGNIYTIWAGSLPVVVFSGIETVKEGVVKHSEYFDDRPETPLFKAFGDDKGILFSNGHTWKQQRKFAILTLRKLGLGKKGVESKIQEEAHQLVNTFSHAKGQPLDPALPITNAVTNVVCALSFGRRFSIEDEDFLKLRGALFTAANFTATFFHFCKKDSNSTYNTDNLAQCIVDLFAAGTETVTNTLRWALVLMANHPDIQEKVQKEIDDFLSSSQLFSYQDWKKLPYTSAVIHEIQRFKYVLLVGFPRQCSKDANIMGFFIRKGATVIPDVRSILFDPKHWETPQEFNPNHFLDKNGSFVERKEFLPFGAGARECIGEQLARIELFIFFTNLLRSFTFRPPEGVKRINEKPVVRLVTPPHPYKICIVPRSNGS